MSRCRIIIFTILLLCIALPTGAQTTRLRLMAANTTSGNGQSYPNPGPGVRIFQAIDADIIMIQEFNVDGSIDAFVDDVFGTEFHWYNETGEQIPNGIISRYPIIESGEWEDDNVSNRDFAYACIDIPGPTNLWAVSVHLLTSGSGVRNSEAQDLVASINAHPVPSGDYLVIGGDFNTGSRGESCISTLSALVDTSGPYPDDGHGEGDTNAGRNKPYDWVIPDDDLDALSTSTVIGSFTFPNGFVMDTREFTQTELNGSFSPALTGDSGASQMQHMAVVRDFLISSGPDTTPPVAPAGLTANGFHQTINLDWNNNSEPDVAGYNVFRSLNNGGPYTQVNGALVAQSQYQDTGLTNGTPYYYVVNAVDTSDNTSPNSSQAMGTPVDTPPPSGDPWINEIHYDNINTDSNEGVEIAGPAGTSLAGWTLVGHTGSNGSAYDTVDLSGTIPDQQAGFGTLNFDFTGLQNGAPDGIALVKPDSSVMQFLSYEGVMTANGGVANGMTSEDIGVSETNSTLTGTSLQLGGTGRQYSDFHWQDSLDHTRDAINRNQFFEAVGPTVTLNDILDFILDKDISPLTESDVNIDDTGGVDAADVVTFLNP